MPGTMTSGHLPVNADCQARTIRGILTPLLGRGSGPSTVFSTQATKHGLVRPALAPHAAKHDGLTLLSSSKSALARHDALTNRPVRRVALRVEVPHLGNEHHT